MPELLPFQKGGVWNQDFWKLCGTVLCYATICCDELCHDMLCFAMP